MNKERGRGTPRPVWELGDTGQEPKMKDGVMQCGRWQSVFFIELDHPRIREVMAQVIGE